MKLYALVIVICACALYQGEAARILGIFPFPSISHQVVYRAVTEALAKRGHEIVVLTPDPGLYADKQFENITEIDVHDISYELWNSRVNLAQMTQGEIDSNMLYAAIADMVTDIVDLQLNVPEMKAIIQNSEEHFDLILVESLCNINFVAGSRFNAPVIGISSFAGLLSNFDAVGNPSHPILYTDFFPKYLGEPNVWQRLNVVYANLFQRFINLVSSHKLNRIARKHYGADMPTVEDAERQMSMLFLNVHPILHGIRPTVPAIVYLGAIHLKATKPLPKDLKKFLDEAEGGAVYISLGSNVKSKDLSADKINTFIEAFRQLPYKVLWKFENETLPNKPHNVLISKWFPQNDLLAHPNIKAFVTQGGLQSMDEAIHHHVPLVGIPFMADQAFNVHKMVHLGIGKFLDKDTFDHTSFKEAIQEVVENVKYRESITRLSELLEDSPDTGLERAVWWSEYVIRHGGAEHLRAPTVPLYQYLMLDIAAITLLVASAVALIAYALFAKIFSLCFGKSKLKQL